MRTSLLICATCLLVTGCSAQFRLPSLSSALSSLTGFGGSSSTSNGAQQGGQSSSPTSPYSGLVRDYGRNLMMAMSSIYPTLFKPPQSQQQQPQQQQQQQALQSPFEQLSASQQQGLFAGQSGGGPSFTLGGSTFSISPSFPFGSLTGGSGSSQQQQQQQPQMAGSGPGPQQAGSSHSPFSASFGSSINSPPSFGPLSSSPFLSQQMPSFAPASSYNAAFEAANGGPSGLGQQGQPPLGSASMFSGMSQASSQNFGGMPSPSQLVGQGSPIGAFSSLPSGFSGQHDSSAQMLSQPSHHQPQSASPPQGLHQSGQGGSPFGVPQQQQQTGGPQQYANSQQFRPDMMSIAASASAPVPSSSSYSQYGSVPAQQGPSASGSSGSAYGQQPSYR